MRNYVIALYIRLSVEDFKTESLSIPNQKLILREKAMSLPEWDNSEILEFIDNGHTGTNFERPAVQELLTMVQAGKINCIIVKDLSRFGRNSIETGYFIERVFPLYHTRFISVSDDFDTANFKGDTGGIDIAFKYLISECYSRDMSMKTKSAKYAKMRRGEYQSVICPYGYRKSADGRMEPDEDVAPNVQMIFQWASEGNTAAEITRRLYAMNIPTPGEYRKLKGKDYYNVSRTNGVWSTSTVLRILEDQRYIGTYVIGKRKVKEIGSRHTQLKDESEWFKIPNHHPAIVSVDLFEKANASIKRFSLLNKKPRDYLLRGKVFCGCCDHAMSLRNGAWFYCRHSEVAETLPCHGVRIKMADLEQVVWPLYSFDIIPIQLISSIYELFFHLSDEEDEKGTYYTPLHLVNLVMDEVYPWEGEYKDISFFDPSCGSGIFLVEAYRRLVCRWMSQNAVQAITCDRLNLLLKNSIFGVDINEEAIRVASFSLSLAMCDFLDPRSIWDKLSFPSLLGKNLISSDFFDEDKSFNKERYDVIVGNPPWQSNITEKTKEYLKKVNRVIGDKQIAQAFSIKCSELCKQNGIICLLMPSKGLLFNRSDKSRMYRANLFSDNNVLAIINLSVYRKFLFDHASGPAAAIIYTPKREELKQPIIYCTPKPIYTIEDTRKFSIDPTDICRIPHDIIDDDRIWKIAMWGAPRDLELIGKMQSTFAPMASFIEENHMTTAEGFKRGNRKHQCYDFTGLPLIEAKSFKPYYVSSDELPIVDFHDFECVVKNAREIFAAPHLIIKQSHKNGTFLSEVLDYDAVFNHSLLGIHGEIEQLKYLSVIIGSRVFSYYHILTNRKWLVERDELEAGDIWQTPIPKPNDAELTEACNIFDKLVNSPKENYLLEQFARNMYRLKEYECYQIDDVIDYVYDYFKNKNRSVSFFRPSIDNYKLYYASLKGILTRTFGTGMGFSGDLYFGNAPLSVLVLNVEHSTTKDLNVITNNDQLNEILLNLDRSLVDNQQMVFVRRNLRIYQREKIFIVKPAQRKYWTYSAACRDADEIFEDISKAWR